MQNLGTLLHAAGVKGATPHVPFTLADARRMSEQIDCSASPPKIAMGRLDPVFEDLRLIDNGREFIRRLADILTQLMSTGRSAIVTTHTFIGLVQLAHERRDLLSGSKHKSFEKFAIPRLLRVKQRMREVPEELLARHALRILEERI